ncbi:MAG: hypothetical protein QNJ46_10240 [Leptolyngbyaceae cyanobacterium MO_188.B28]|nr:hypothetical protein [Leptolyngbyaceae cyanobacterium MO_188.B28]
MKASFHRSTVTLGIMLGAVAIETLLSTGAAFSQEEFNRPLCYLQTETGNIIDLTHVCDPDNDSTNQAQLLYRPTTSQQRHPVRRGRGAARSSRSQTSNPNRAQAVR